MSPSEVTTLSTRPSLLTPLTAFTSSRIAARPSWSRLTSAAPITTSPCVSDVQAEASHGLPFNNCIQYYMPLIQMEADHTGRESSRRPAVRAHPPRARAGACDTFACFRVVSAGAGPAREAERCASAYCPWRFSPLAIIVLVLARSCSPHFLSCSPRFLSRSPRFSSHPPRPSRSRRKPTVARTCIRYNPPL